MSVNYLIHCEVFKEHRWVNIDFWQRAPSGEYHIVPVANGQSMLGSALRWHELLSQSISWKELSTDLQNIYSRYPDYQDWRVFDYNQIKNMNFEQPQYCGYVSKGIYKTADTDLRNELLTEAFENGESLSPSEFAVLTPSAQQGFVYCEYTNPYGHHNYMREIIRKTEQRLRAYQYLFNADCEKVRLVIYMC